MITLIDAIAALRNDLRARQARLELLAEAALGLGDQPVAEQFAQEAADLLVILDQTTKLAALPPSTEPLPAASPDPSREERGARAMYVEALCLLETAQAAHASAAAAPNPSSARLARAEGRVAVFEELARRVQTLCRLTLDHSQGG